MMNEQFFEERGIYYRSNKFRPDISTLVFIHGLSGSSSAWKMYEKYFDNKYNLLSLDLRGHGKSFKSKKFEDYSIHNLSEDVRDLLRYLKINKVVLISHSFGALIALDFLSRYEDVVEKAVFLSPNYFVNKRALARLSKPFFMILSGIIGIFPFSRKSGYHVDYDNYQNTGDWNLRRMFADISNTGLRVYLYCTLQSYIPNYEDLVETIQVPVLLVHGEKDTIFPASNSIEMNNKIKDSKLIVLPMADHIVVLNNFVEVSQAIERFIVLT